MDDVNKKDSCNKCNESFPKNLRRSRLQLMENDKESLVGFCNQMQSHQETLCPQFRRYGRKYECSICGKCFAKPCLVQRHTITHAGDKPFQCTICSKCFTQKSSFQRHLLQIHTSEKSHKCIECNKSFSQKSNMSKHFQRVHALRSSNSYFASGRFPCDRCSCVYSSLNSLNRHRTQYHVLAVESEATRVAKLAETYRDETTIDDADELARSVLVELKKLQGGMMEEVEHSKDKERNSTENKSLLNESPTQGTIDWIEDTCTLDLVEVCDKLNPLSQSHTITVQCIRRNDGVSYYVCEFCAKEFRKTYDLIRHRRIHLHEKPFKCELCDRCCITKTKLEEHKKWHVLRDATSLNKKLICAVCEQVFQSIRQLDMHASLHTQTHLLLYICSICGCSYRSFGAFSKHKHKQKDKELEMVTKLIPAPVILSANTNGNSITAKPPTIWPQFKCQTCERLFSSKNQLNYHYKIYTTHKQFVCPKCNVKFSMAFRLRRHLLCHTNQRNFQCVYCEKTYKSRTNCRQHMQLHIKELLSDAQGNEVKPKKCLAVVQEKPEEPITASLRSTSKFIELQSLPNYHRHRQHRNITVKTLTSPSFSSPKICTFCQREFKKTNDLQRHLRTHTKERPFKCNLCDKSFALASTLKEHTLTHAHQRTTHDCQVCGKSYASKKVLVLHLRIHTGERPFKCSLCEQTFRTSGHRQAHMKANHK